MLAESGIDWVPMLRNRTAYVMDHSATGASDWPDRDLHPNEVLSRNFWFGVIELTSSLVLRHEIGIDRIVLESDYPHADSTWPTTATRADAALADLPPDEADAIRWANAADLFRFPVATGGLTRRGAAGDLGARASRR